VNSQQPDTPKKQQFTVDKASGRIISAGPEEIDATQPLLEILISEAGWNAKQIVSRPNQWRVVAHPSAKRQWPVDIAIFDEASNLRDPDHITIICECKRPDVNTGVEQLKIYLDREPHARVGVWFNGLNHAIVYKTKVGYEVAPEGTPIPCPSDPLVPTGAKVLTYGSLRTAPSLVPVFRRIRDRLATMDSNVNRDEEILPDISLLLLLKILDEQSHRFTPTKPLSFQIDETPQKTAKRLKEYLDNEVKRNSQLFGANSREIRFQIDDNSLFYTVEVLQNYRLLSNDKDAVAEAFQVIRGKAYKGEEGQYFTPQSVVRIAIAAIDPRPEDRVIDPACGSGSFLATALSQVIEHLKGTYGSDESGMNLAKREWSTQQLYALDKDSVSVRLSKAYLSMLGDGSTHVFKWDSIRTKTWPASLSAAVQDGAFDVVVTNPPFGTKLRVKPEIGREEKYTLSKEWKYKDGQWNPTDEYTDRDLGLLFLERSVRLLRPDGRLAIVLPDTYLFSDSYGWLVQWLSQFTITHSINVPIEAFEPHCRAKTSVIVLRKSPPKKGHQIIGSFCETFGEDKHGRARYKFVEGKQTTERDDEMTEAVALFKAHPKKDSKLFFRFPQDEAVNAGVLVASYWWRKPYLEALETFASENACDLVSIADLMDSDELKVMDGHGSPSSHYHGRGTTPYIKVVDIKNWRMIENPKYAIPEDIAKTFRRSKVLKPFDIVTPTRASKNIGLFGVVMPWQMNVILTREIAVWRIGEKAIRIDPWLLIALMSLRVVHEQFQYLVLMQMNREDLGARYKEILLPIPRKQAKRNEWSSPIQKYFQATTLARESYDALGAKLDPTLFADRP
jgi:type I restriction enzyme M protein